MILNILLAAHSRFKSTTFILNNFRGSCLSLTRPAVSTAWLYKPVCFSPVCLSGLVSSCKSSLSYLVSRPEGGNVAVIAVGGAPEALDARPGALTLQVHFYSCVNIHSFIRSDTQRLTEAFCLIYTHIYTVYVCIYIYMYKYYTEGDQVSDFWSLCCVKLQT